MNKYKVLAINDDQEFCSCCGKQGLKRVVWLINLDKDGNEYGEPVNYGTSCAGKLLGFKFNSLNKTKNKIEELAHKTKIENELEIENEKTILNRVFIDKNLANLSFWKTHYTFDNHIKPEDTFFMTKNNEFVRVWNKENNYIKILIKNGFENY